MALSRNILADLVDLKKRGALENFKQVVEIGAQQLSPNFTRDRATLATLYSVMRKPMMDFCHQEGAGFIDGIERLPDDAPPSREFWQSLGFSYNSIEFDGHRDSIAIDLNRDRVPRKMRRQFDLVINTGTTEHVANQDNAFRVMHDLARVNGIMMHEVPAGGMMNHGLVNYNTKFFFHLCRENNYEVLSLRTMYTGGSNPVPRNIVESNLRYGGTDIPEVMVPDFFIFAALRKAGDAPYVTPMDIPADLVRLPPSGLWRTLARSLRGN